MLQPLLRHKTAVLNQSIPLNQYRVQNSEPISSSSLVYLFVFLSSADVYMSVFQSILTASFEEPVGLFFK